MYISKAKIENFKSIKEIEIPFDKVGDSYTKIFVGINESGKSNILEALSYFNAPEDEVSFDQFCNQKIEDCEYCNIYFSLNLEEDEEKELKAAINEATNSQFDIDFAISNIVKNVYIKRGDSEFEYTYDYDINLLGKYFVKIEKSWKDTISVVEIPEEEGGFLLNATEFKKNFDGIITDFIEGREPSVSVWKPSKKYLLCDADLNVFKDAPTSNRPLYNIFKLSGYADKAAIKEVISKVANSRSRSRLMGQLKISLNKYINNVWSNNIDLIIEITETGKFSLLIKDKGEENENDRFSINERSQGAKHFLSLILSLSLETKNQERKNELILIDEPEVHLHPSGIRDLAKELLKIGEDNFVFLATHSPFMIDKSHRERHFIVKKDKKATTELKRIKDSDNIIDDEVLREAFGIDVYRDLLNPHRILVEGATDKVLLQKALNCLGHKDIGITNGTGSNIITLASRINYENISIFVLLDDDGDGKKDKEKILKIGGGYTEENVFTIRDLVGDIVANGTIEDTLGQNFVKAQFVKFCKQGLKEDIDFEVDSTQPIIKQIVEELKKKNLFSQENMDAFKKQLSDEFKPTKTSLGANTPLLQKLAEKIVEKIKK
ncbi:ATP-dependent nuclease [Odoribacter lunatus]|uniref:ATP-dependent nuclease n=1 Tax=Odoribacter lunatus TaxID=2941335 RepID=UPI00203E5295|nr:AAA family ATPase [Odoribacter lunatus]